MAALTGKILIVDDETALLVVMEQYLRRLGYDVVACRSSHQAWKSFEPQPAAFSLVLADITMPQMSGRELLQRMLELNSSICILICSGYPFDVSTLPAHVQPQVGFLQKPFTPRMLSESIEQVLAARNNTSPG